MAGIKGVDYIDENGNRVLTGGKLAAAKNLAKNPNYYRDLGKRGAEAYNAQDPATRPPRGFAYDPENARRSGKIGGARSKRGPSKKTIDLS